MARLQSKVKLGFYPTPPPVAKTIARYLKTERDYARFRVLDPCVGDAMAIKTIVDALGVQHQLTNSRFADYHVQTYGIEPQATLAQVAAERLTHLLNTSFFSTTLSNGNSSDGGWQFIYLNSPYDNDTEQTGTKGKKVRLEFTFLQRATLKLCANGLLIWVIPHSILARPGVAKFLVEHYDQMHCVRFPDASWRPPESREEVSMYGQFKQIVLFLRKREHIVPAEPALMAPILEWAGQGSQLPIIGTEEYMPRYEIPNAPLGPLRYFLSGAFDPDDVAAQVGTFSAKTKRPEVGVWAAEDYWAARCPNPRQVGLSVGHPLHTFKKGYMVVFAIAGLCNRAVLRGRDGRRILVKGVTRKTTHYSKTEDDDEIVEKVTDKFESSLWCTDLSTGQLLLVRTGGETMVGWAVPYEILSMADFLDNFGGALMEQIKKLNAPRYQHESQVPWARQAFSRLSRQPLGKQYSTILAQVHAFVNEWKDGGVDEEELLSRIAEVAEMASGKTFMATATAFLADLYACGCTQMATPSTRLLPFFPAVVLCPPIMARKWKREIEQTIPNARVVIVERFGPRHGDDDDDDEQASCADASAAFRAFDPDFTGSSLSTVGSVDRIVARITYELEQWQTTYNQIQEENKTAIDGGTPLPLKPCHVVIVTFSTAKLAPEWRAEYSLKPVRFLDNGKVKMLKRANAEPAMAPCCPHCMHPILDERKVKQQLKNNSHYKGDLAKSQRVKEKRAHDAGRSGNLLNMHEKRVQEYLYSIASYRALLDQRDALREGSAPYDARYVALEQRITALLLGTTDEQYLLFHSEQYRQLIIEQDQLIRSLQWECEQRIADFLSDLAQSDEEYRRLLSNGEALRASFLHQEHRLSTYEEEMVHPVFLCMDESDLTGTKDHRVKWSCLQCGEPLWQYVSKRQKDWRPFSVLDRDHVALPLPDRDFLPPCVSNTYKLRYPIADYINHRYKGFFKLLIADEVHEGADRTALDFARQSLANACGRMLGLTGTLSNGYASSLFRLYYLILKRIRDEYAYHDEERWIDDNGKRQMVQKTQKDEPEEGSGSNSKRKIRPGMPVYREVAGVSPSCMGKVAQCSTLTELREVVPNLPHYREEVRIVPMGPVLGPAYAKLETEATRNLAQMLAKGDKSALAPWYTALLTYPSLPYLGWECRTKSGKVFGTAPALPEEMVFPLERMLIDYVQEQQDKGLRVLVFAENTGVYDVQPRLKKLLETKVRGHEGKKLKVVILRSKSTKTIDREQWLEQQVKAGVDVLICNPRLVKVGLDLIAFPRIAYMSFPRSTTDLRQSARRSLRPGQQSEVEVVFFTYIASMGLRLLHLMARKTQASLMVEGNVASDGLVSLGQEDEMAEGDIIGQMAREMVNALGQEIDQEKEARELQEMFRQAAELEQQQNQAVDDESVLPPVQMETIRQIPLSATASFDEAEPTTTPSQEEMVTAIPITVTDDPWAEPIVASAAMDAWAALRQQYKPTRKGRRK